MNLSKYLETEIGIESDLYKFLNQDQNLVIFDIGCCEGEDSIRYSNLFKNSKIYAFEPLKNNYKKSLINFQNYNTKNVVISQEALSDSVGITNFYVSSGHPDYLENTDEWDYGNKSSSLLHPKEINQPQWMNFNKEENIKTNTIDNFCKENSIEKIDFVHMDVQGAELLVLKGASSMLKNIGLIWLEVGMVEFYQEQPMKINLVEFLQENNFTVIKDTCPSICGDILVVNNNLIK
jgi:FkbM family methyltransferase